MKKKLTLRLEETHISNLKKYARKHGTSVSQLVTQYSEVVEAKDSATKELSEITQSFVGILPSDNDPKEEYRKHLEEKYLK